MTKAPWAITASPESVTAAPGEDSNAVQEVTFTVTNTGSRALTGRAALEADGGGVPAWVELRGGGEGDFEPGATRTFTARVAPGTDARPGRYVVRLSMVDVHRPDEGEVEGPDVAVHVPELEDDEPRRFPRLWVAAVAAFVVLGAVAAVLLLGDGIDVNEAPALSGPADQHTFVNTPVEVAFRVADEVPADLTLEATSSDPTLVPAGGIVVSGSAEARTLTITPTRGGVGSVDVTVVARDPDGEEDSATFTLDVTRPYASVPTRITASDATGGSFGASIALNGTFGVVGDAFHEGPANATGAAYVFRLEDGTWREVAKLTASDPDEFDRFGMSVAIDGDHAAIAARFDDEAADDAGAVYIFRRRGDAWNQVVKLMGSEPRARAMFGFDLALEGDRLLVGAPGSSVSSDRPGAAFLFERDGDAWNEVARLQARGARDADGFGRAVALDRGRALIGAPDTGAEDESGASPGAAYVFERRGEAWAQEATLTAPEHDGFGQAVAMEGERLVVGGADTLEEEDVSVGTAQVFEAGDGGWERTADLTGSSASDNFAFGSPVALAGDLLLVGAAQWTDDLSDFSSFVHVYHHREGTWAEVNVLASEDVGQVTLFSGVAVSGEHLWIGARIDGSDDASRGAVYAFRE